MQRVEPDFKERLWNWKFIVHATILPVFSAGHFSLFLPQRSNKIPGQGAYTGQVEQ